jgi:hypothetical protein
MDRREVRYKADYNTPGLVGLPRASLLSLGQTFARIDTKREGEGGYCQEQKSRLKM